MKIIIASDLHGSEFWTNKLMRALDDEKPDKLLLLGDYLYHGPRNALPRDYCPSNVCKILNSLKKDIIAVRGNCDAEVDQMVLEFPIMTDYAVLEANGVKLYATHGHIFDQNNNPLATKEGDIFVSGHTHIPRNEVIDGVRYVNPGSVAIPKGGSLNSYMVFNENGFSLKFL